MVATKPVDFAALVTSELRKDPFTGAVFVFRSRKADRLKLIYLDVSGMVMAYKRLEEIAFTWPGIKDGLMTLNHSQFETLFAGLDWRRFGPSRQERLWHDNSRGGFPMQIKAGFDTYGACMMPPIFLTMVLP